MAQVIRDTSEQVRTGPLDGRRAADVKTIAIPHCIEHPPMSTWPDRNLATGACPCCSGHIGDGKAAVRILNARRLIKERHG